MAVSSRALVGLQSVVSLLLVGVPLASADSVIHFSGDSTQFHNVVALAHRGAVIELDSDVSIDYPLIIQDDLTLRGNVGGGRATITTNSYIQLITVRANYAGRAPSVEFDNIVFSHGYAKGGNGGIGYSGGGGAAGMGGALLVSEAYVRVQNCIFQANQAIGGNGGYAQKDLPYGGGGGGVEGNDGGLSPAADDAASHAAWGGAGGTLGGGFTVPGQKSVTAGSGGSGGTGTDSTTPTGGGFGGGGGGVRGTFGVLIGGDWTPLRTDDVAGSGGYGGGGGGGVDPSSFGLAGFGGGAGSQSNVVYKVSSYFSGGAVDINEIAGGGGGGAGMGGAIFVRYGIVEIFDSSFQGNSAHAGAGAGFVLPSGDPSCEITSASDFFASLTHAYCWTIQKPSSSSPFNNPPLNPSVANVGQDGNAYGQSIFALPELTNGLPSGAVYAQNVTWDPNDAPGSSIYGPVGFGFASDLSVSVSGSTSAQINQYFPATVTVHGPPGVIFYVDGVADPQTFGPALSLSRQRFTIDDTGSVTLPPIRALNAAGQAYLKVWSVSPLGWGGPYPYPGPLPSNGGGSISYMDPTPKQVNFTILPAPYAISMTTSPNPAVSGTPVSLTGILDSGALTQGADQRLLFYADGEEIGTRQTSASTTLLAPLTSGTHLLSVQGNGSVSVLPSLSPQVPQVMTGSPAANRMASTTIFPTATGVDLTATDFNSDGYPDLVVTTQNGVSVLTSRSDGTFANTAAAGVCSNPTTAIARAISNPTSTYADVAIGCASYADGVFMAPPSPDGSSISAIWNYSLPAGVESLLPGDFNGDGYVDLVVSLTNGVAILLSSNSTSGGFVSGGGTANNNGFYKAPTLFYNEPGAVALGNFHNNSYMDLLVASNPGGLALLPGSGELINPFAMFGVPVQLLPYPENPQAIAVRDFNGDGNLDVAAVSAAGVSVLLGNGDGTFRTATNHKTAANTSGFLSLAAADMDGDGNIDLVAGDIGGTGIYLFRGNGDGTFQTPSLLAGGLLAKKLIAGDFNRDGRTDLAALTSSGVILLTEIAPVTFSITAPAGAKYRVDGVDITGPANFSWDPSSPHIVDASAPVPVTSGVRQVFLHWGDSLAASHTITAPASGSGSLDLTFKTQYGLATAVSPAAAGTISPDPDWFDAGSSVTVSAAAASGFKFANFSGSMAGTTSPQSITMSSATSLVANFTPLAPSLSLQVGARSDGPNSTRVVAVTVANTGQGSAQYAMITGVTATVLTGSGTVSSVTPLPLNVGTVNPGTQQTVNLSFNWPSTAARVTLNFTLAAGSYTTKVASTIFR